MRVIPWLFEEAARLALPKLLGHLRDGDSKLSDRGIIHHHLPSGLQIHSLAHAHIRERIIGAKREREAPVKHVAVGFAPHR